MAIKFVAPLDLLQNEIQNGRVQNLASAPASPVEGQFYYNTVDHSFYVHNGTGWDRLDESYLLARANHTGTQAAATISDLATVVQAYRLDQFAAPTADVSLNSHKITNLATPTGAADAVTKAYADALVNGLQWKQSARAATTGNITLSGAQTIDAVSVVAGDRVLVKAQTTGSENGIWVAAAGAWARAADADADAEVRSGLAVVVDEGTAGDNTAWVLATADPIVVGTTALTFVQLSGSGTSYTAGTGLDLTGTTFSRDPTYVDTVAQGGTNASTAAGARANLGATGKYSALIGDGSSTSFTINQSTHGLAADSTNLVQVTDASSGKVVFADVTIAPATGNVTIAFSVAPASNAYRVTICG